jgi:hypothetical protein
MSKVKTIKDLIEYCFYTCDGNLSFGFNECWEIEHDENIDKELIVKLKKICPDIMDKCRFHDLNEEVKK